MEEYLLPAAGGGDAYGPFLDALSALARIGTVSPAARATLRTLRSSDRRLSAYGDYRAFLQHEEIVRDRRGSRVAVATRSIRPA
ncbi:hypothetical protein ACGFZR_08340 [Streptomyces sp. NPDC048241]|uniref:hypothetical protein n=1 Tax=Streptomyces sp. NPDC048241 TaxID=3365521 RepID=UPI0037146E75